MRITQLTIMLPLVVACQTTKITSSRSLDNYFEDLSSYRLKIQKNSFEEKQPLKVKEEQYKPMSGHIQQELDSIIRIAYQQNKKGKYVDGFTIQVYSGNSRDEAQQAKYKMNSLFPNLNSQISYYQPNFKVKTKNFIHRLEANRVYKQVKHQFPSSLLLPERFLNKYE